MAKSIENERPKTINIIGNGSKINGDIVSDGDFRVDGIILGNFKSNLKIIIGECGYIEGNVDCKNCEVLGKIHGNINVSESLVLRESANIEGDIKIGRLSVEPGASLTGHCSMLNTETENIPNT